MASFETNVFRDGAWRRTTISTQEALAGTAKLDEAKALHFKTETPRCGIMTRTVVPSPNAHWILPVRIRSRSQIDVAFIGSNAVQISELKRDGQLLDIVRKADFGSRICNAVVMGDTPNTPQDIIGGDQTNITLEDAMDFSGSSATASLPKAQAERRVLPPQVLVLFLENGTIVFLFLAGGSGSPWRFEITSYKTPWHIKNIAFRVAIDPSSRYLAASSSQNAFMIWELENRDVLEDSYERLGCFMPMKKGKTAGEARSFQGCLFHLEFLYPRPEDADHIILMMVVARCDNYAGGMASRVLTFDWMAGDDLKETIKGDSNGIRLPDPYELPLMVIPLRFKNSICVVSEKSIGVIKNAISGTLVCDDLMTERPPRTPLHHGQSEPLWAAWARPIRGDWYCKNTDIIMLAREDGYLVHIEVDAANVVPSVTSAGCLDSTISTAFAMPYIEDADAIIVRGDSSPGGTWKLSPRADPVRTSTLRNWSPVVDITTAPFVPPKMPTRLSDDLAVPRRECDVLIAASGRGAKGSLSSFRWGQHARIGFDVEIDNAVRQIGAYMAPCEGVQLFHVALSLPEDTMILQFSRDLSEVRALDEDETLLDQSSRTLGLLSNQELTVQITEHCITLVAGNQSHQLLLQGQGIGRAEHAACTSCDVVLSCQTSGGSSVHSYTTSLTGISSIDHWEMKGEVTCLSITSPASHHPHTVAIGSLVEGYPWVSFFDNHGKLIAERAVASQEEGSTTQQTASDANALYEGLTGMHIVVVNEDSLVVMAGTVWGRIVTFDVSISRKEAKKVHDRKIGNSAARLYPLTEDLWSSDVIVTCDDHAVLLSKYSHASRKHTQDDMIIATTDDDAASQIPPIRGVSAISQELRIGSGLTPVLLLAGSRIMLAELTVSPKMIPRSLPMGGTPTQVLYSDLWKCYIVALVQDNKPTITFVDPTTGSTISQPTANDRRPTTFATGLGGMGDGVLCMVEWPYSKDGKIFPFVLVGMRSGVLLTMSAKNSTLQTDSGPVRQIEYWTRHKRKGSPAEPIYSVLGVDDGVIHCAGDTVYYCALEEKKMRDVTTFRLGSAALDLKIEDGKLFVLTSRHSLLVLDHRTETKPGSKTMRLLHADSLTRGTIHMMPMRVSIGDDPNALITLLADASANVVGVWAALGKHAQPLSTVFKASMPVPIRRFAQGRCRPPWYGPRKLGRYGTLRGTADGTDTFGVGLDGALYHFTLLGPELLEVLKLIQHQAKRAPGTGTFAFSAEPDEAAKPGSVVQLILGKPLEEDKDGHHIDGDLMARCLKDNLLEGIAAEEDVCASLFSLMDRIEDGAVTKGFRDGQGSKERYYERMYQILEYLNASVL